MSSKASEPIGNSLFGPFFVRISLGAYFVLAGLTKMDHIDAFVQQVKAFGVLSNAFATAYGGVLPYMELIAGVLLISGFMTTVASVLASVLLFTYIYAIGLFPYSKIAFASNLFNKDIILFCAAISLMYTGPGAFSIDRFRKSG